MTAFDTFAQKIAKAQTAEELFGDLASVAEGRRVYHGLAGIVHEDRNPTQQVEAKTAFQRLNELWTLAQQRLADGTYGTVAKKLELTIKLKNKDYTVDKTIAQEDIHTVFSGADFNIHLAKHPNVNDLVERDAKRVTSLMAITAGLQNSLMPLYFPRYLDHGLILDEHRAKRYAIITSKSEDFVSLAEVKERFPEGVDPRHVAWIGNRLFTALGFIHEHGIVHGWITPAHVLVHPDTHAGRLVNWAASGDLAAGQSVVRLMSQRYPEFVPPEVTQNGPIGPPTDIWMAARVLLDIAGGQSNQVPLKLPERLRRFLNGCLIFNPARRPQRGWEVFDAWQEVVKQEFGERKFVKLSMSHG